MNMRIVTLAPVFMLLLGTGCQPESQRPQAVETAAVEKRVVAEEEREVAEVQRAAAERARWKVEAERKARERRAAKAAERLRKKQQLAEKRREEAASREAALKSKKAEVAKKKADRALKKEKLEALLRAIEKALDGGKLQEAEKQQSAYRLLKGESALREPEFQQLRQRIIEMKRMFADMEQANMAEQYLQQLMDEAQRLGQQGDTEAARRKYGEVLMQAPGNHAAQQGLERLSQRQQKRVVTETAVVEASKPVERPKKPKKSKNPEKMEKKSTTLLGSNAAGWVVQVATYPEDGKKEAYALLGAIKKSGFKAVFVKKQELAGRKLYRIRVGAYGDKSEAVAVSERLLAKMDEKGIKIANRITRQR